MRSKTPKLLHPICGWPMIAWPVAASRQAGATRIVVVDAPGAPLRNRLDSDITVVVQQQPRGTADALKAALPEISAQDTVVVLYGDVPLITAESIRALAGTHEQAGAAATMLTATLDDPSGYGRVVRGADGAVERVVETKQAGDATAEQLLIREVNTGIYAFAGERLEAALEQIGNDNAQGEYYLPDVLPALRAQGHTVAAHALGDVGEMFNVNDRRALAHATRIAQRRISDRHMLAGVTIVNPDATVIDADVSLGEDVTIEPGSALHGATTVGDGSTIGPHSTLRDATVGKRSRVIHSHATDAVIADGVSVGPFAYVRPGTVLRDGAKAGSFVEIKNSDVGERAKVPHLSYIGDATIGEDANLGASTVTANYDGRQKHRTRIGARVHTGVDTTLIAPITIGDDAWTGSGSVLTEDVPEGSLAIARPRQTNHDGYDARVKARQQASEPEHTTSD